MRDVQPHSQSTSCGWDGGLGTRLDVWVGGRQQLFTVYEKNKFTIHYISCWYDKHVLACMYEQDLINNHKKAGRMLNLGVGGGGGLRGIFQGLSLRNDLE